MGYGMLTLCRMRLTLPATSEEGRGGATLADLKRVVAAATSVPYSDVVLVHSGLVLRDERAALVALGLREGSRITLSLSGGTLASIAKKRILSDTSESGLLSRIHTTLSQAQADLFPAVSTFETSLASAWAPGEGAEGAVGAEGAEGAVGAEGAEGGASASPSDPACDAEHRRLSELLLRALLDLDAVPVNSDSTRAKRKEAVKLVQSHLDRVDAAWEKAKVEESKSRA